jgi:ankyrin repeat protein
MKEISIEKTLELTEESLIKNVLWENPTTFLEEYIQTIIQRVEKCQDLSCLETQAAFITAFKKVEKQEDRDDLIRLALLFGRIDFVTAIAKQMPKLVDFDAQDKTCEDLSFTHIAVMQCDVKSLSKLQSAGFSVKLKGQGGLTCLHMAILFHHTPLVNALKEDTRAFTFTDTLFNNTLELSPVELGLYTGDLNIIKCLDYKKGKYTDNVDLLKLLVIKEHKGTLNYIKDEITDKVRDQLWLFAVGQGHIPIAHLLMRTVHYKNEYGQTGLHWAITYHNKAMLHYLLNEGIELHEEATLDGLIEEEKHKNKKITAKTFAEKLQKWRPDDKNVYTQIYNFLDHYQDEKKRHQYDMIDYTALIENGDAGIENVIFEGGWWKRDGLPGGFGGLIQHYRYTLRRHRENAARQSQASRGDVCGLYDCGVISGGMLC